MNDDDTEQMRQGRPVRVGKHLWAVCPECERLIKVTGWTRGFHLCREDDDD